MICGEQSVRPGLGCRRAGNTLFGRFSEVTDKRIFEVLGPPLSDQLSRRSLRRYFARMHHRHPIRSAGGGMKCVERKNRDAVLARQPDQQFPKAIARDRGVNPDVELVRVNLRLVNRRDGSARACRIPEENSRPIVGLTRCKRGAARLPARWQRVPDIEKARVEQQELRSLNSVYSENTSLMKPTRRRDSSVAALELLPNSDAVPSVGGGESGQHLHRGGLAAAV